MEWEDEFIHLAEWALSQEELRHRYIYAHKGSALASTPGIDRALEVTVILAIYQTALGKGYIAGSTVEYEKAYPGVGGNPPRADLAFKNKGRGKNWAYIEAKRYGAFGKSHVQKDIAKLSTLSQRSQRWLFIYRVRRIDRAVADLETILRRNFKTDLAIYSQAAFPSIPKKRRLQGVCDLCLARI